MREDFVMMLGDLQDLLDGTVVKEKDERKEVVPTSNSNFET